MIGYVIRIAGKMDRYTTAAETISDHKVNLILVKGKVELRPFVRPLSEAKWWWAQPNLIVKQDGSLEGSVFLGERGGKGSSIQFQIVVFAVPRDSYSKGGKLVDTPLSYAASNSIIVKRN